MLSGTDDGFFKNWVSVKMSLSNAKVVQFLLRFEQSYWFPLYQWREESKLAGDVSDTFVTHTLMLCLWRH